MEVDTGRTTVNQKMEGWTECFQDLRSWCPPDRDELNTPQITMQDEFNFSPEGQVNCNNNWGYVVENHPVELITDSWVNNDLQLASPNNDEENNNYPIEYISSHNPSLLKTEMLESVDKSADYNGLVIATASSNVLKTKGNILLSQATLEQEDSPAFGEGMVFTDYIKLNSSSQSAALHGSGGKIIKFEEPEEFHVPIIESTLTVPPLVIQHQQQNIGAQRRLVTDNKRARLKLTIPQAPQTTNESNTGTLSTPEVLKTLTDIPMNTEFDLLKFVEGLGSTGKSHQNNKKTDPSFVEEPNYTDSKVDDIYIKAEPLSPPPIGGIKRHLPIDDSDLDSDDPSNVDPMEDDDDDSESEEWFPDGKQSRKSTGKRRGRKPSSVDSFDGQDKYRALRDRNNEASRRSRLNRKQRDMEMKKQESDLARKNIELKIKADRMETLVKEIRAALLISVRNSRDRSS